VWITLLYKSFVPFLSCFGLYAYYQCYRRYKDFALSGERLVLDHIEQWSIKTVSTPSILSICKLGNVLYLPKQFFRSYNLWITATAMWHVAVPVSLQLYFCITRYTWPLLWCALFFYPLTTLAIIIPLQLWLWVGCTRYLNITTDYHKEYVSTLTNAELRAVQRVWRTHYRLLHAWLWIPH
jgi:hypothetical protein